MENETFISCVAWIHRGFAAHVPFQCEADPQQIQNLKKDPMIEQQLQQKNSQNQMQQEQDNLPVFSQNLPSTSSKYPNMIDDLQDEEKQDYYIEETDALIVTGKIEKEHPSLEVYVYEQEKNNLYVHHQIMLSSFPLAIEWLNCSLSSLAQSGAKLEKGNYAIVSSFLPEIEIWNLDQIDAIEPEMILGGEIINNKKKPKKFTNKAKKYKEGSHTDSVLSLSLNPTHKNILASGSADCSLKIWDLSKAQNIHTSTHHEQRVKKVNWSPVDNTVIYTISQDGTLAVLDSRYPNDKLYHKGPKKQSIECACWNPNQSTQIGYGTNQGNFHLIDVRSISKSVSVTPIHHGQEVTDVKIGRKNILYSCSEDETVRVWNLNEMSAPLANKKPNCGKMYCLDLYQVEQGPIVTCGNGKGELFVWDVTENAQVDNFWKLN